MIGKIRISDIINAMPFQKLHDVSSCNKMLKLIEELQLTIGKEVRIMLHGKEIRVLTIYKRNVTEDNIHEIFLFSQDGTSVTFYYENDTLYAFRAITLTADSMHEISSFIYTEKDAQSKYMLGIDPDNRQETQITLTDKNMKVNRYFLKLFRDSWGSIKRFCQVA